MRKTIRLDFSDFWPGFVKDDNYFYKVLNRRYDIELCDTPDFLIASCFSRKHFRYRNCVKILYMGENLVPDFNLFDYAMGFHDISFEDRYLVLPHYALYPEDVEMALHKHAHEDAYYLRKKKFFNRVVSNPEADARREELCALIERIGRVDSGGRYKNNVGGPVGDKRAFAKAYRFSLAFENSSTAGYMTEKLLQAFAAETLPLYWGDPKAALQFNPKAFIDLTNATDEEAERLVRRVYADEELYLSYMKAPALAEDSLAASYLREDYAEDFLYAIVERGKNAYRRNTVYVGERYEEEQRISARGLNARDALRRPLHYLKLRRRQRISGTKQPSVVE